MHSFQRAFIRLVELLYLGRPLIAKLRNACGSSEHSTCGRPLRRPSTRMAARAAAAIGEKGEERLRTSGAQCKPRAALW
jgi:hypothetical protein